MEKNTKNNEKKENKLLLLDKWRKLGEHKKTKHQNKLLACWTNKDK